MLVGLISWVSLHAWQNVQPGLEAAVKWEMAGITPEEKDLGAFLSLSIGPHACRAPHRGTGQ